MANSTTSITGNGRVVFAIEATCSRDSIESESAQAETPKEFRRGGIVSANMGSLRLSNLLQRISVARQVMGVRRCVVRRSAVRAYGSTSAGLDKRTGKQLKKSGWTDEKKREFDDAIENYNPDAKRDSACTTLTRSRTIGTIASNETSRARDTVALEQTIARSYSKQSSFGSAKLSRANSVASVALSNGRRTRAQKICKKVRDCRIALKMAMRSRFAEGKQNAGDMGGILLGGVAIVVVTAVLL